MIVKVCGITRREDAQVAVDAGASAIGFIFYKNSSRYIQPDRAAEIGDGLKIWKVGIFVDAAPKVVESIANASRLDVVQLYGGRETRPEGLRIWFSERVDYRWMKRILQKDLALPGVEAVLLDGLKNGASFDWSIARVSKGKVIVAGGLDASNVAEAIRIARPWGVDASSKLETSPGIKDHAKVRAFVSAALKAGKEVGLDLAAR